jgi:hypothetical protein
VLDGRHPAYRAHAVTGPVPLVPAHGRYWAVPTEGGRQEVMVRYAPGWRTPALTAAALGVFAALGLVFYARPEAAPAVEPGA